MNFLYYYNRNDLNNPFAPIKESMEKRPNHLTPYAGAS